MKKLADMCPHVDKGERAIAWALRDEPVGDADSGWRLLCAAAEVGRMGTQANWTIARVLREEPSFSPHIDLPAGTMLQKEAGAASFWRRWQ
jgi:hypothetical protein